MTRKTWVTVQYALRHGWLWILAFFLLLTVTWSFAAVRTTEQRTGHPTFRNPPEVTLPLPFSGFTCVMVPGECFAPAAEGVSNEGAG